METPVTWDSCTCTVALTDRHTGETFPVRTQRWDCPSCGRDKANKVREMIVTQGVERLWVLTFTQPEHVDGERPERHELCDELTHVYQHKDGRWLWRMLESCEHCCRYSSRCVKLFRERLRRRYPDAQVLWVKEVKPQSGSFDINVTVSHVPVATRRTRAGRRIKQDWHEVGGGFLDLGDGFRGKRSPGAAGRYIGKYLTKLAHRPMAKHFRRWGRSQGFAPSVRMAEPREPNFDPQTGEILVRSLAFTGWMDVDRRTLIPGGGRRTEPPLT